jgi:hypothetical protein
VKKTWPKIREVVHKNGTPAWLVDARINGKGTRWFFPTKVEAQGKAELLRVERFNNNTDTGNWSATGIRNLVQHKSGLFYARLFVKGKEIWKALKTSDLALAEQKLAILRNGRIDVPHYVYAVRGEALRGGRRYVKIGISQSVAGRTAAIECGVPFTMRLINSWKFSGRKLALESERLLHEHFATFRCRSRSREWFTLNRGDIDLLRITKLGDLKRAVSPSDTLTTRTVTPPELDLTWSLAA